MLPFRSVAIATTPGTLGVPETTLCRMRSAADFTFSFICGHPLVLHAKPLPAAGTAGSMLHMLVFPSTFDRGNAGGAAQRARCLPGMPPRLRDSSASQDHRLHDLRD